MTDLRILDLFSGIGGFSLGFERAGLATVAFCEQDGYARRVLKKHWPSAWLYDDIRTLTKKRLKADGLAPNVVCGGFPCQDICTAGKGAGLDGARSGLWSEMLRIVKEVRPRWVIAENVPALRGRGADRVLADLEGAGYAGRPIVVGAWAVGGNHQRERVWIVANAGRLLLDLSPAETPTLEQGDLGDSDQSTGEIDRHGLRSLGLGPVQGSRRTHAASLLCRKSDGIPARVDRLRCLGNAVVPLIPELIGRFIKSQEARLGCAS